GDFDSSFSFAGMSFSAYPGLYQPSDGIVLKYSASGIPQSAFQISGDGRDRIGDLFISSQDHLLISGIFSGSVLSLGPNDSLTKSSTVFETFFAEYDNAGNVLRYAKPLGQSSGQMSWITADTSGNIYLAGFFFPTINFGIISFSGATNFLNLFWAKYGACGAALSQPAAITGN